MDVKIEAAAMTAQAEVTESKVATTQTTHSDVFSVVMAVVSSSCPSLGSHSISAVAPDSNFEKENLAVAA